MRRRLTLLGWSYKLSVASAMLLAKETKLSSALALSPSTSKLCYLNFYAFLTKKSKNLIISVQKVIIFHFFQCFLFIYIAFWTFKKVVYKKVYMFVCILHNFPVGIWQNSWFLSPFEHSVRDILTY